MWPSLTIHYPQTSLTLCQLTLKDYGYVGNVSLRDEVGLLLGGHRVLLKIIPLLPCPWQAKPLKSATNSQKAYLHFTDNAYLLAVLN